jgi:hypothetical protein
VDRFTNSVRFEVIAFESASAEMRVALESWADERTGRRALAGYDAAMRAESRQRTKTADRLWKRFERRLNRMNKLSEEERGQLLSAIHVLRTAHRTP